MSGVYYPSGIPPVNKNLKLLLRRRACMVYSPATMDAKGVPGTEYSRELGDLIRAARERKGLGQWELAQRLGFSTKEGAKVNISHWEHGRKVPVESKIGPLCRALGLDLATVARLCVQHRNADQVAPAVLDAVVAEQLALPDKAPADPKATAFARDLADLQKLDQEALVLVRKTAALVARLLRRREQEGKG